VGRYRVWLFIGVCSLVGSGVVHLLEGKTVSEELKPCPYCGEHFIGYTTAHGPHDGQFQMVCGCGARGPATPEKSVVAMGAAWNRRTPDWRELALEAATWVVRGFPCFSCGNSRKLMLDKLEVAFDGGGDCEGAHSSTKPASCGLDRWESLKAKLKAAGLEV
jgi:Lar family restriction alleviation protein